jgi:hypothetical protein
MNSLAKTKIIIIATIIVSLFYLLPPKILAQDKPAFDALNVDILRDAGLGDNEIRKIKEGLSRPDAPLRELRLLIEAFNSGRIDKKEFVNRLIALANPKNDFPPIRQEETKKESTDKETSGLGVITAFIAIAGFIAGIIRYYIVKKKKKSVSNYFSNIDDTYSNFKMKSRRCEAELYRLQDMIIEDFKNHKIDESSFALLEQRINNYLQEIRQQILADSFGGLPMSIKSEITKMFGDKTIDKGEYESFLNKLKGSDLDESDKNKLKNLMQEWEQTDVARSSSKSKKS